VLKKIEDRAWEVKKELAARVKNQLRRIPELRFFPDDTLDHVFKMEEIFKKIKDDEKEKVRKSKTSKSKVKSKNSKKVRGPIYL
jgi:ribosome-binding factor A